MTNENIQPTPGLSGVRKLSGSQPGLVDPTQPSRLLRLHGAKLSFAAFDPLTACSQVHPDTMKPSNAQFYRPKRVVIEIAPSGECTWRFVPSAKRENGVADEGAWPRIVNLCGELVEMTQDQWDIYKLDPFYECFVPGPSEITNIQPVSSKPPPLSPQPLRKRELLSPSPPPERSMPPPAPPRRRNWVQNESDSDDEDEVEAMIANDEQPLPRRRSVIRERRERLESQRQARRGKLKGKIEMSSQEDDMYINIFPNGSTFESSNQLPSRQSSTPEPSKRKATSAFDTSWSPDSREVEELGLRLAKNYIFSSNSNSKRTRTSSPQGPQREREFKQKRLERNRIKQQRRMAEVEAWRYQRDKRLLDEIMEEIPQAEQENASINDIPVSDASMAQDDPVSQTETEQTQQEDPIDAEDAARRKAIEESRRKLAELESDRPLWEEQAKQRRLREEVEQQAHQAKIEEQRREEAKKKTEVESRARKEREEVETKKREQEKNARRERELRDQERRQRRQRWSFGPWTTQRALERYRILSESFDTTKFTVELPLNVEDVPWPSLQSPRSFSVEDVTWDSVERFFEAIRPHLRHQDYKTLVEQSHRRFHPDRWRSRNLLKTVEDEVVRGCMEVAANTVAQALTPIWRGLKDR